MFTLCVITGANSVAYAGSNHNPAGNNGDVKISEGANDGIPQNDPHVGCTFFVEFYNYDKNNSNANVNFALQAPTNRSGDSLTVVNGNLHPFIGGDSAGGGKDLDAREQYTLSFTGTPQANQGYHVRLTVDAPGSKGHGTKQKVFWVKPCVQTASAGTTTPSSTNPTATVLPNTGNNISTSILFGSIATVCAYTLNYVRQLRASFNR